MKRAADQRAADHFGRLDVVINNAGYGHFGMIEELTEDEVRSQLETNLFGALWVTQAALPIMRAQGSGHIIQVSSIGGISAFPTVGAYHASKWALEGFSQSLAREVAGFGINVTLIDPGGYATDWSGPSATRSEKNPAYADVREAAKNRPSASDAGDPAATRRRPGGDPRRDPQGGRRRRAAAADLLRQDAARDRDQRLRVAPGDVERMAVCLGRGPRGVADGVAHPAVPGRRRTARRRPPFPWGRPGRDPRFPRRMAA